MMADARQDQGRGQGQGQAQAGLSLRRTWLLTRLLTGGSRFMASGIESKPRSKTKKVLIGIAYVFLFVYLMAIVAAFAWQTTAVLQSVGMASIFPEMLLSLIALLSIVFGVYYLISIFYHADETTYILALPFQTTEIVAAKFIQTLTFEYMITGMIFVPAILTYGITTQQNLAFYLMLIPLTLLLPVIPLALLTIVVMLLMRVVPFAKNKDRMTTVMNILILGLVFAFSFGMNQPMSDDDLLNLMLGEGAASAGLVGITAVNRYIPGLSFGIRALAQPSALAGWMNLLLFALACLVAAALVLLVGRFFYLDTLLAMSSGGGKKHVYETASLQRESRSQSAYKALVLKEFRLLFRTPAYFMNNILSAIIMPVFILIMPLFYEDFSTLFTVLPRFEGWALATEEARLISFLVIAGITAYQLSFGSLNSIACTAISREGEQAFIMKYLPQPYSIQFLAKLTPGLMFSALPSLILLVAYAVVASASMSFVAVAALLVLLASALMNVIGLLFDVLMPKLKWENETQAVKNNLNAIWSMLVGFVLCLIPIFSGIGLWKLGLASAWLALALIVILALLLLAAWQMLLRVGSKSITVANW